MENRVAKKLAEEIHNKHKIMEIELDVLFPMTGGYSATPFDKVTGVHLPEAKDFKYLWRWWARVLFSGITNADTYEGVEKYVCQILGGSGKGHSKSLYDVEVTYEKVYSSFFREWLDINTFRSKVISSYNQMVSNIRFRHRKGKPISKLISCKDIRIETTNYKEPNIGNLVKKTVNRLMDICKIPRVTLVLIRRRDEDENEWRERVLKYIFIPDVVRLRLKVYTNKVSHVRAKHIVPLLLGLYLGGVGSASNRGMGSIIVRNLNLSDHLDSHVKSSLEKFGNTVEKLLKNEDVEVSFIEKALIKEVLKVIPETDIWNRHSQLPKIPTISVSSFKVCVYNVKDKRRIVRLLGSIGILFTRFGLLDDPYHGKGDEVLERVLLGLPRSQERASGSLGFLVWSNEHGGYDKGRRRTMISAKVYGYISSQDYIDNPKVIIVGLPSTDLYEKFKWVGGDRKTGRPVKEVEVELDENTIRSYFDRIYSLIIDRIKSVI